MRPIQIQDAENSTEEQGNREIFEFQDGGSKGILDHSILNGNTDKKDRLSGAGRKARACQKDRIPAIYRIVKAAIGKNEISERDN